MAHLSLISLGKCSHWLSNDVAEEIQVSELEQEALMLWKHCDCASLSLCTEKTVSVTYYFPPIF